MWWRIAGEVVLAFAVFAIGTNFWACLQSRRHLDRVLRDANELRQFVQFIGHEKIIEAASFVKPIHGSYEGNIEALDRSQKFAVNRVRNYLLLVLLALFALSYWLGTYFLVGNVVLWGLLAAAPLSASGQNNNFAHVQGVIGNIYAWRQVERVACEEYCTRRRPQLRLLFELIETF